MTAKRIHLADLLGLCVGIGLGCALLLLLVGCADTPRWGRWSQAPTEAQITAALGRRPQTWIYFSNYQIYLQPARHEYVFWDGRAWITRPEPPAEFSPALLEASPKVELELSDYPGRSHAEVVRHHPRDWKTPGSFLVANP